jgi:hypothetical protein
MGSGWQATRTLVVRVKLGERGRWEGTGEIGYRRCHKRRGVDYCENVKGP